MFKKLLVPIDGSATSLLAVDKAIGLAKACGSAVDVLYVLDPYPYAGVGHDYALGLAEYMSTARSHADASLDEARKRFAEAGVPVKAWLVESHAVWRGILEAAKNEHADLIVMGSHGRGGLEKLMLGSVAQRVLAHAQLPVLIIRSPA